MITARIASVPTLHDEAKIVHVRAYQAEVLDSLRWKHFIAGRNYLNQCQQGIIGDYCKRQRL